MMSRSCFLVGLRDGWWFSYHFPFKQDNLRSVVFGIRTSHRFWSRLPQWVTRKIQIGISPESLTFQVGTIYACSLVSKEIQNLLGKNYVALSENRAPNWIWWLKNRIKPLLTTIKPALNQHFPYIFTWASVVSNTATPWIWSILIEVEGWLSKRAQDMGKAASCSWQLDYPLVI